MTTQSIYANTLTPNPWMSPAPSTMKYQEIYSTLSILANKDLSTSDSSSPKWIRSGGSALILKVELLARAVYKSCSAPNSLGDKSPLEIDVDLTSFRNVLTFLEGRLCHLKTKKSSKAELKSSKLSSAAKYMLRKKSSNALSDLSEQIKRLSAAILSLHACCCNLYTKVYMKEAIKLVKAVQLIKESYLAEDKLQEPLLQKAIDLVPVIKKICPEKLEEIDKSLTCQGVLKILKIIKDDSTPIPKEQKNQIREVVIQTYPSLKTKILRFRRLTLGELNILRYAHHTSPLLIPHNSIKVLSDTLLNSEAYMILQSLYQEAQRLILIDSAIEKKSDSTGVKATLKPSHTGIGAGIGAGAAR